MSEQIFNTRIIHKHDIEENWNKAVNFIPKQGELIVYDIDENYNYERFKIGDGLSNVNDLPFAGAGAGTELELDATLTMEGMAADAKVVGDAIKELGTQIDNAGIIDIDLDGSNEGETNLINADTLGGYAADEYVRKDQYSIELNYSVVDSITEPTDRTQNMIWVQTEDMNGYILSKNKPKNPSDGFVWISLGGSSGAAFHTFKIGNVEVNEVFPISAKQYVNGAWVDVTAKSWQNGEWTPWIVYLYHNGNEYENVTGGWTINGYGQKEGNRIFLGKNENYEAKDNTVTTNKKLVFGGSEVVEVHGFFYSSTTTSYFEVRLVDGSGVVVAKGTHNYTDGNNIEVILTVTAPTDGGEFYVQVAAGQTTKTRTTYAYFNFVR